MTAFSPPRCRLCANASTKARSMERNTGVQRFATCYASRELVEDALSSFLQFCSWPGLGGHVRMRTKLSPRAVSLCT